MEYIAERIAGSRLEELHCSIILHYEALGQDQAAEKQVGEYMSQINDTSSEVRMSATMAPGAMVVAPMSWTRHSALLTAFPDLFMKQNSEKEDAPFDLLAVIGGTKQDEAVFQWANELEKKGQVDNVFTVSTGTDQTEATATSGSGALSTSNTPSLEQEADVEGIISVLQQL
jgi:trehalose 6-phosphate synthase complex regulatory subunit